MKISKAQLKALIKEELETMEEGEHDDPEARRNAANAMVELCGPLKMTMKSIARHPELEKATPDGLNPNAVERLPNLLQRLKKAAADVEMMIKQYGSR
tara:strand:- start:157 stop:450 length:294 start_codon:yes stop_codon:yes gene_type:complete